MILAFQICRPYNVFGTRDIVFTKNIEKTKLFQSMVFAHGGVVGPSGGPWAAPGSPLGLLGVSLGRLGASTGCLEGLDGTFF